MKRSNSTAIVLIASLLLCGFTQSYLRGAKARLQGAPIKKERARIAGINSYAIGLVLGGLRGPLVMALWSSSENQKMDQDLQSINTKIKLISILQPNFDSVHIFQMWNTAFNLSAQMTSSKDRYGMILDALDYGKEVDEARPDNVNILSSIARIYVDKLSFYEEKVYFENRVRNDTLPSSNSNSNPSASTTVSKQKLPTLLDSQGRILPEYLKPTLAANIGPNYNGATLQYLQKYSDNGGFPYGIPPEALAFNYYRRCADLIRFGHQTHAELSDAILESRDLYCLYNWAQDEEQRALRIEASLFGKTPKNEIVELETAAQSVTPKTPFSVENAVAEKLLKEALFSCWRSSQVAQDAIGDYKKLIADEPLGSKTPSHLQHLDDAKNILQNSTADGLYLKLIASESGLIPLPQNASRAQIIQQAKDAYQLAINEAYRNILQYLVNQEVATKVYANVLGFTPPRTFGRWTLDSTDPKFYVDPKVYPKMHFEYEIEMSRLGRVDDRILDINDYKSYINRSNERLKILNSLQ